MPSLSGPLHARTYTGSPTAHAGARGDPDEHPAADAAGAPLIRPSGRRCAVEDKGSYYGDYPLPSEFDHWFDAALDTSGIPHPTYPVTLDDALTTGSVRFTGLFYGGRAAAVNPDQSIACA